MLNLGDKLEIKDIEQTQDLNGKNICMSDEYIRYEIDRMRPNYGISSDLLRYKILDAIGGAYFDSDVKPGKVTLEESGIFDREFDKPQLYLDRNSQGQNKIGNDALISTPNNPVMQNILHAAKSHYHLSSKDLVGDDYLYRSNLVIAENNSPPVITYQYDEREYITLATPFKTGPFCVRKNVETEDVELKSYEECGSQLDNMEDLVTPSPNNGGWVGKPIARRTFEEASRIILDSINWEMNKLGILRIDDHINNLVESSRCEPGRAIQEVLAYVQNIDLKKLESVQITHAIEETVSLYNGEDEN
jgi:hypothetical protein